MAITIEDIKRLAELARIDVNEEEMKGIINDIDPVLAYVDQLKSVEVDASPTYELKNVGREDEIGNESGSYTEVILREAPDTDKGYIKVHKVL